MITFLYQMALKSFKRIGSVWETFDYHNGFRMMNNFLCFIVLTVYILPYYAVTKTKWNNDICKSSLSTPHLMSLTIFACLHFFIPNTRTIKECYALVLMATRSAGKYTTSNGQSTVLLKCTLYLCVGSKLKVSVECCTVRLLFWICNIKCLICGCVPSCVAP